MDVIQDEDLYEILGVSPEADETTIRKAYKKLAVSLHPDKYVDKSQEERENAQQAFSKVSYAYNVLRDEEQRNEYDFMRRMKTGSVPAEEFAAPDPNDQAEISAERKERAEKYFRQGVSLQMEKNTRAALEAFKEAVKMDPGNAQYHTMLAVTYQKMGWTSYAIAEVHAALKIQPKDPLAIKIRSQLRAVEKAAAEEEEARKSKKKKKKKKEDVAHVTRSKKKPTKGSHPRTFKKKKQRFSLLGALMRLFKR